MDIKDTRSKNTKTLRPKTFVEMRAALTPSESDVLDIIFFMMDKEEYRAGGRTDVVDELTYCINAKDYEGLFINNKGEVMSAKRIYERVKNGADGLYELDLQFVEDTEAVKKGVSFRAIGAKAWNAGNCMIKIQLTPMFLAIIKEQRKKSGYAIYDLRYQLALKGEYAKRLYPMLLKFKTAGQRFDSATELRDKLGIPDSYSQSKFISIIDKAVKEINDITNIFVTKENRMHTIRGGKALDNFVFLIQGKDQKSIQNVRYTEEEKECIAYVKKLLEKYIQQGDEERIAKCAGYDCDRINDVYEYISGYKSEIHDGTAFIIAALNNRWKAGKRAEKQNAFTDIHTRKYDFEELEKMLLATNH